MTWLSRVPIHPVLLAAYAVLLLYAANLDEVLPVDAAAPLGRAVLVAAGVLVACALVYRSARRGALVATALVIVFFGYGRVAAALTDAGADDRLLLAASAVLIVGMVVYAARARGSLPRATAALNVAAIVLVVLALSSIVPYEAGPGEPEAVVRPGPGGRAGHPADADAGDAAARHLLPHLRPLRVGRRHPAPVRDHRQPDVRLARGPRLPGPVEPARELPRDGLLARRDPEHAVPRQPDPGRRARVGRPDAGPGDDRGPRRRDVS